MLQKKLGDGGGGGLRTSAKHVKTEGERWPGGGRWSYHQPRELPAHTENRYSPQIYQQNMCIDLYICMSVYANSGFFVQIELFL